MKSLMHQNEVSTHKSTMADYRQGIADWYQSHSALDVISKCGPVRASTSITLQLCSATTSWTQKTKGNQISHSELSACTTKLWIGIAFKQCGRTRLHLSVFSPFATVYASWSCPQQSRSAASRYARRCCFCAADQSFTVGEINLNSIQFNSAIFRNHSLNHSHSPRLFEFGVLGEPLLVLHALPQ